MPTITYLGQMCCLIETPTIRVVTDPYLSDSVDGPLGHRKYPAPCTLADLSPDVIVISHPHGDHLDKKTLEPFYRLRMRSFTLFPAPSGKIIESIGGHPTLMRAPAPAEWGEPFELAGVKITPIPCAHTELHRDENGDFAELSYLIEADGKKIFFGGDMSMYAGLEEALRDAKPDVMFLPVNGSDWFRTSRNIIGNLDSNEAADLSVRCGAKAFIPGHHDLYASNGCPDSWVIDSAKRFGAPLTILKCGESLNI